KSYRSLSALVPFVLVLSALTAVVSGQTGQPSTANGEWPTYNADRKGTRYSPLDQINGSNFNKLEIAWRFKTDNLGPFPEYKLEGTPLMVKGVLYTTGGTRRSVVALDAKTGELIWTHSYREGKRAAVAPRQLSGRGVAYWTDGKVDDRVLYVTTGYRLIALNAKNGAMINSFGKDGVVDLKVGAVKGNNEQIDLETGEIGIHSTPIVVKDTVIIGSSMREGATVPTHNNTKGLVRAYDARTGKQLWRFNTMPGPGEFGNDTWENGSWAVNGNGRAIKTVALPRKLGWLYVLDRLTSQPVWPIEKRPVEQSTVPGEKTSPTQPFPTKPPAYSRQFLKIPDDVIDFTPALREQALQVLEKYHVGTSPFTPPILGSVNGPVGAVGAGTATNWP